MMSSQDQKGPGNNGEGKEQQKCNGLAEKCTLKDSITDC